MQEQETGFNNYSPELSERESPSPRESSPEVVDTEGQILSQEIRNSAKPLYKSPQSSSSSEKSFLPDAQQGDPFSETTIGTPEAPDLAHIFVGHPGHPSPGERSPPITPTPSYRPNNRRKPSKPLSDSSLSPPVESPYSEAQRSISQPPTAVKQTPTVTEFQPSSQPEATEMSQINVPEFSGASDEDSARWCRLLECAFVPVRRQYTEEAGMNEDEAKCYILLGKTQGAARKWMNEQDDEIMRNWKALKEQFVKRFPKVQKKGKRMDALSALYSLKQDKRDLDEYFDEAREIYNSLPKELLADVSERVIDGLDSENVKGIVGGILGETTDDFERVLTTIRGVVRQKGKREDSSTKKEDERMIGLSSTDRVLLGVLQQNSTLMDHLTKSFASMNVTANQKGAGAPYHNPARQANREQQREPLRASTGQEEQRNGWAAPANQQRRGDLTTGGGSKGNYFSGPRNSITCWTCGQEGHASQGCTNPPLPVGEQDRIRSEFFARRASREKDATPASGSNSVPLGRTPAIGVHQVEDLEDDGVELTRPHDAQQAESFKFGSPFHRPNLQDWDTGDEYTTIKETFQCENCGEEEEAMALGDKRTTVEYEEDDAEASQNANRSGRGRSVGSRATKSHSRPSPRPRLNDQE